MQAAVPVPPQMMRRASANRAPATRQGRGVDAMPEGLTPVPALPRIVLPPNGALQSDEAFPEPDDGNAPPLSAPAPAAPAAADTGAPRSAYPLPAPVPTQEGPEGIRFDFNLGCRVVVPEGAWHVRLSDLDTGNILFETDSKGSFINSIKRYFIRFAIEVWEEGNTVFRHEYSAHGRDVLVQFPVGTLGDLLGWFPYAVKFKEQHGCRLTCAMSG
jgi:hypothetical protein